MNKRIGSVQIESEVLRKPVQHLAKPLTCKAKKDKNKPKLTTIIEHIKKNLIASKRFCFANALLPYGAIGEANAHCTHLQIAHVDPQTEICKRVPQSRIQNKL